MTNTAATFIYRRQISEAWRRYHERLKAIYDAHDRPMPPTASCIGQWAEAWATCRVQFHRADIQLHFNRGAP